MKNRNGTRLYIECKLQRSGLMRLGGGISNERKQRSYLDQPLESSYLKKKESSYLEKKETTLGKSNTGGSTRGTTLMGHRYILNTNHKGRVKFGIISVD